jgi:hypothetical protein
VATLATVVVVVVATGATVVVVVVGATVVVVVVVVVVVLDERTEETTSTMLAPEVIMPVAALTPVLTMISVGSWPADRGRMVSIERRERNEEKETNR